VNAPLLQVSDPHFGTERPAVLSALLRLARAQAPALVLLSGDITQRARPAEFAAAQAFVQALPAPVLAIPGNHDVPLFNLALRAFAPCGRQRRMLDPELEGERAGPSWLVLGVDTTCRWRHKDGRVSAAQVERVAQRLESASPHQLRIVLVHHPVAVTRPEDRGNLLHGHERAVRRWASAGADLVVGGHIHLPYVLPLHGVHAGLPRRVWAVQAGTAVSSRVRHEAGNSVNMIRPLGGSSCVVERWDYRAGTDAFELVAQHRLDGGPVEDVRG
jgi:3',5'-cyclic AMP phosphodiesterase CpdA